MRIALIGSDIPSLLPGFLTDMFYAHKDPSVFMVHEPNPALGELLEKYAGMVIAKSRVRGTLVCCRNLEHALENADAIVFADSVQNTSRFQMDVSALSGQSDGDEGLKNQARVHDGIGGLLFTLRTGAKALALVKAMQAHCPRALVLNMSEPLSQITALFHLNGFECYGFGETAQSGPAGTEALCRLLGKQPSGATFQTAGLYRFQWLAALFETASQKDLMPKARQAYQRGEMGLANKQYASWYDALPIGQGHGESLPANECFEPDLNPELTESIEKRKQRLLHMNEAVANGLDSTKGQLAQLNLIRNVPKARPVQCALMLEEYPLPVLRRSDGSIKGLPPNHIIQAGFSQQGLSLPQGALDITTDVAFGHLLMARAAMGDSEALREYIETAPALAGLDRLYLHSQVMELIHLHQDVLPLYKMD